MNHNFKNYLLSVAKSSECKEIDFIQFLWSGYGRISRYELVDSSLKTVVVKCIDLTQSSAHPRGWNTNKSHTRKVKSYKVETHWYENWNQLCTTDCKTPEFIGSFSEGEKQWIVWKI